MRLFYGESRRGRKERRSRPGRTARITYPGEGAAGRPRSALTAEPRGPSGSGRPARPEGGPPTYPEGVCRLRKRPSHARVRPPDPLRSRRGARGGRVGPRTADRLRRDPGLREWYVSDDIEELEYAALSRAAAASLRLIAALPEEPRRRVVVAFDVPDGDALGDPDGGLDPDSVGEVRLASAVPLAKAAAVHVDSDDAEKDVTAAAAALGAADHGDDDARFTVDGAEDHELLWFGVQEIPQLLG